MARVMGACSGLLAFAATIFAGLAAGNSIPTTVSRSLWAMGAFFLLGSILGHVAQRVIDEYAVAKHKELFGDLSARGAEAAGKAAPAPAGEPKTGGSPS